MATTLQEENFVCVWDVVQLDELLLGLVNDIDGSLVTVGDLTNTKVGSVHVRRFQRGRGTCGTRGQGNVLQGHQQGLTFNVGKRDIDTPWVSGSGGPVQLGVLQCQEPVRELLGESLDVLLVVLHVFVDDSGSLTEPGDQRWGQGPGSQPSFLATTSDDWVQSDSWSSSDVDGTHTLRTVDLVRGDGKQVDVHLVDVDWDLTHSLGAVRVEEHLVPFTDLPDLGNRLNHTDFVVHSHHRDQSCVWSDGGFQLVQIDQPVFTNLQIRHLEPFVLHVSGRVQDTLVLGLHRDDVLLGLGVESWNTLDGHIVGLGGSGSEDDFLWVSADQVRNVFSGLLDLLVGLPAVAMCV
ncbi:hypothetical protein WICPIJ_009212 [Wickerhamomyces pijperi]|uniref:Uncharacterized protein n=1 Tax=Wickerhamomyces pijperi TaxID=599730 RepID=A0A9P8PPA3_WICPI|nr:hypothetical protein WICPIJ_009212 [Wickerhamomyces pijperi]